MTATEIGRWIGGAFLLLLAGQMVFVTGRFMMAALGESSYLECSAAFLHPVTRWFMYYLAVPVVAIAALLVLPHWVGGIVAVLWVAFQWFRGTRVQIERGLSHYVQGMLTTDPTLAEDAARRRMTRSLYRNLRYRMMQPVFGSFARIWCVLTDSRFHRD